MKTLEKKTFKDLFGDSGHVSDPNSLGAKLAEFINERDPLRKEIFGWSFWDTKYDDSVAYPGPDGTPAETIFGSDNELNSAYAEIQKSVADKPGSFAANVVAVEWTLGYFMDALILKGNPFWLSIHAWRKLVEYGPRTHDAKLYSLNFNVKPAGKGPIIYVKFPQCLPVFDRELIAKLTELEKQGFKKEAHQCTCAFCR